MRKKNKPRWNKSCRKILNVKINVYFVKHPGNLKKKVYKRRIDIINFNGKKIKMKHILRKHRLQKGLEFYLQKDHLVFRLPRHNIMKGDNKTASCND